MDGITPVAGATAGLSQAQFQVEYQVRALKMQQNVLRDVGTAALTLIQRVMAVNLSPGQSLDIQA